MIRDYTNPNVRLPESVAVGDNLNPVDEDAIETVRKSGIRGSGWGQGFVQL